MKVNHYIQIHAIKQLQCINKSEGQIDAFILCHYITMDKKENFIKPQNVCITMCSLLMNGELHMITQTKTHVSDISVNVLQKT